MARQFDLVIKKGTVLTPAGAMSLDVGVRAGKIVALGSLEGVEAAKVFDAQGLHVLPGVIDSQVHFREPGLEHKEDLAHGTKAAVLGGVTAIFEMPNTSPLTLSTDELADKFARADGRAWCDHAFFIGGAAENVEQLPVLEAYPGCAGVKIFMGSSTGSLLVQDDPTLARILANGRRRVAVHAEDEERLIARRQIAIDGAHPRAHPEWRDVGTALLATQRILKLARAAGRRVHVLHVTTGEEMELLAEHKDLATVECTLNHLTLAAPECYERLGAFAQMNPPVRDAGHRDALWRAIASGVVDVIGSDHAPHTREEKEGVYPATPSGMPGVQTLLPLLLDHMHAGRLSLERLVDLTSAGPARIYNIAGKGRIARGYDADFTLVDLKAERTIENKWIASKCGWTPFDGMAIKGWPMATIIRGAVVMREDEVLGAPIGKPVAFNETLGPAA